MSGRLVKLWIKIDDDCQVDSQNEAKHVTTRLEALGRGYARMLYFPVRWMMTAGMP